VVLGAVITDGVIVQRLTDYVWVGLDSVLNEPHITRVARLFHALKASLEKLDIYYRSLHPVGDLPAESRYFPSITAYPDDDGLVEFEYVGFLENSPDCTTLRARTKAGQDVVVKFVEQYGERAHRLLADAGMAPKLLYCGSPRFDNDQPSYRSISLVVMEYVDGETLAVAMPKMNGRMVEIVRSEVQRALELLRSYELVFGDLRPPNVLITEGGKKVNLIDFNGAGEDGQAKYPSLISRDIPWPEGVEAMAVMKQQHDLAMLRNLFLPQFP
jgi:serine/threonine protein kinase